jgi:hypothetical protein
MKSSNRESGFAVPAAAAALISVLALMPFVLRAQAPGAAQSKPLPVGSIAGRVVDAATGAPVKDVTLLLVHQENPSARPSSKSDEEGRFAFKDLESGSFAILAQHPRYALQTYGSRNGILGGTLLSLSTGQDMKDIAFKLLPNGIASGKVLDPDGEPVAKVLVAASKGLFQHGKRQFIPVATAVSDDLGQYRLSSLAPGRYVISATPLDPTAGPKPAEGEPETALLSMYYPNSPDAAGAQWVEIAAGADAGGMDIKLSRAKAFHVRGKVVGEVKDQGITVKLIAKDGGLLASVIGRSSPIKKPDDTFDISGATKGSYLVRAGDRTGLKVFGTGTPVEIGDKAPDGVIVELGTNADLAGTLNVVDGDMKPVTGVRVKGAQIYLEAVSGPSLMPPNTTAAEDGSFTLKELPPDKYLVRVANGPAGAYVESVHAGAVTMGEQGLDLAGGRNKLEIRMRAAGAEIAGVVNGPDDNPISGVTVALLPDNGDYMLYQTNFTDQNGAFRLKGIKPGDYKMLAWEDVEPNAYMDQAFVKPYLGRAEKVTCRENDHKSVTLKVIPRGQ